MSARRENLRGWIFVAPATAYLLLFSFLPLVIAGWMSLHDWHLLRPTHTFIGLKNFSELLGNPFFQSAVWNSLRFALLAVPSGVVAALAVAALVNRPLPGIGVFRTIYFIPAVSSQAALAMIWVWVFLPQQGLVNWLLAQINQAFAAVGIHGAGSGGAEAGAQSSAGLFPTDTAFLSEPAYALPALVLMFAWLGLGPRMVIFLAGLKNIPIELHEAADLDGAGAWQRFRHVTLPLLLPTTLFVAVTTTIASLQFFTPVYMITRGGPRRTTDLVAYHIYQEAWTKFELGMASAQTYLLLAMILVLALAQLWLLRRGLAEEHS